MIINSLQTKSPRNREYEQMKLPIVSHSQRYITQINLDLPQKLYSQKKLPLSPLKSTKNEKFCLSIPPNEPVSIKKIPYINNGKLQRGNNEILISECLIDDTIRPVSPRNQIMNKTQNQLGFSPKNPIGDKKIPSLQSISSDYDNSNNTNSDNNINNTTNNNNINNNDEQNGLKKTKNKCEPQRSCVLERENSENEFQKNDGQFPSTYSYLVSEKEIEEGGGEGEEDKNFGETKKLKQKYLETLEKKYQIDRENKKNKFLEDQNSFVKVFRIIEQIKNEQNQSGGRNDSQSFIVEIAKMIDIILEQESIYKEVFVIIKEHLEQFHICQQPNYLKEFTKSLKIFNLQNPCPTYRDITQVFYHLIVNINNMNEAMHRDFNNQMGEKVREIENLVTKNNENLSLINQQKKRIETLEKEAFNIKKEVESPLQTKISILQTQMGLFENDKYSFFQEVQEKKLQFQDSLASNMFQLQKQNLQYFTQLEEAHREIDVLKNKLAELQLQINSCLFEKDNLSQEQERYIQENLQLSNQIKFYIQFNGESQDNIQCQ